MPLISEITSNTEKTFGRNIRLSRTETAQIQEPLATELGCLKPNMIILHFHE